MNKLSVMDPRIILYLLCPPAGVHRMHARTQEHTHTLAHTGGHAGTHNLVGKLACGLSVLPEHWKRYMRASY